MGEDLYKQVQAYTAVLHISAKLREGVNKELIIASARGIIWKKDSGLLAENGGAMALTNDCQVLIDRLIILLSLYVVLIAHACF